LLPFPEGSCPGKGDKAPDPNMNGGKALWGSSDQQKINTFFAIILLLDALSQ
jgi:hypothetical protein